MIRKLRLRLVAASMLSLLVVLVVILGGVNLISYRRIVTDADKVVSHAAELRRGSAVRILFADGFAAAEVQEVAMNTESSGTGEQMP